MTRRDLAEKRVEKLDGMEQALEMINMLDYNECIAALKGVHQMPYVMHKALIDRAKSLRGNTSELIIAGIQAIVNC